MSDTPPRLFVACFCAAWCRTCDEYLHVFHTLQAQYAENADFVWVDIEDHSDVLDNIDVDNFPTLLISDAEHVYFWGTVLPHLTTASKLMGRAVSGDVRAIDAPDIFALNQRLRIHFFH
ncbi:thioredoxin family protein [Limnohabitans sp.]|uniref:thioredoxin family protein n=1 Tax=Limnohabitans sp. TaxID=1907725 RepID=UPI00286F8E3E|nr:thioredoxin family protein [Limnohabitans sp.]